MKTKRLHRDINDLPRIAARFISGFFTGLSSRTSSREGDSTFLSANSAGAVALEITATLWNGDPGGASGVTAPLEFVLLKHADCNAQVSDLLIDEFISDNLLDECVAPSATDSDKVTDIVSISVSKERPAGTMRGFAEGTLGAPSAISIASRVLFSWLRRSPVRACLSWRAERLARNLFSSTQLNKTGAPFNRCATIHALTIHALAVTTRKFATRFIAEMCNRMSVINHSLGRPWGRHYRPQFL